MWESPYDPFDPNAWWQQGFTGPTATETINWAPESADMLGDMASWLENAWQVSDEGPSEVLAGYLALNPYDPTDELNAISTYHQNVGTMTNQMSDQLYKQFSDQQNLAASRGFAGSGDQYNRDAAKRTFENTWLTGQFTAQNQMEADIDDAHDEFMDSWWEILLSQENAFTFDPPVSGEVSGGWVGGDDEDYNDPDGEDDDDIIDDTIYDQDDWDFGGMDGYS